MSADKWVNGGRSAISRAFGQLLRARYEVCTVNGAGLRTGDLFASGTVSGPGEDERGSLIELSCGFLDDGDEVVITATAPGRGGTTIGFGDVSGTVVPASGD